MNYNFNLFWGKILYFYIFLMGFWRFFDFGCIYSWFSWFVLVDFAQFKLFFDFILIFMFQFFDFFLYILLFVCVKIIRSVVVWISWYLWKYLSVKFVLNLLLAVVLTAQGYLILSLFDLCLMLCVYAVTLKCMFFDAN